jgi:hypothetical protein
MLAIFSRTLATSVLLLWLGTAAQAAEQPPHAPTEAIFIIQMSMIYKFARRVA